MATRSSMDSVQIVNADLAPELQNILREKMRGLFKTLGRKVKRNRELIYTVNGDNTDSDQVLRNNPASDVLFSGFNYDVHVSDEYKNSLIAESSLDLTSVDPELRYPVIAEYRKHMAQGKFRHRKLVLVGDIYKKLEQIIKSDIPLQVSYFAGEDRNEATQPIPISSISRLAPHQGNGAPPEGKIDVSTISRLSIADISFDGIINMPEVDGRFLLNDHTVLDTIRLLFAMEGVKEVITREFIQEEKLTFVRGKRVFILLDPDLEHIITERLTFDKMQQLFRHTTLEEAEKTLETGKSRGLVDYFEFQGYDVIFDLFDQDERDRFLLAVMGDKLGEYLNREIESQKSTLIHMDESDLESLLYKVPEALMTRLVDGVKDQSYEKFLALVPTKIRETVILAFLSDPKFVSGAWKGIGDTEKVEILAVQAPQILANLNLVNGALFKQKFPSVEFEFSQNYDSSSFGKLSQDEQVAGFKLFTKSIQKAHLPDDLISKKLSPPDTAKVMGDYIRRHPVDFYNGLNPVVRKQLWITVGREYRDHISESLHFLDKTAILKGNKEKSIELLFSDKEFLAQLKSGSDLELSGKLFLTLKKMNKTESKGALLKIILTGKEWEQSRRAGIPGMLSDPENMVLYRKLAEQVEGLEFSFQSLICTREHYEKLKDREPVRDAIVTIVDDLVDSSLFNLFEKGDLSKEEYNKFSKSVEDEIATLRGKMTAKETEDPVGVYLLESMQILQDMATQAMQGKLSPDAVEQLDGRQNVRQRLINSMTQHVDKIDGFMERAVEQIQDIENKLPKVEALAGKHTKIYDDAYQKAKTLMGEMKKLQSMQAKANNDRKKVALKQKELSVQFFDLIQPLILEKVKALGSPMKALMKVLGFKKEEGVASTRRVIFKFSEEEIKNILRYNIIFCTKNDILMQFIVTCLRIDNLQDSLFQMGTLEALPKEGIDILFYGPEYDESDFGGVVKQNRTVKFADEAFLKAITVNEKLKARTKAILVKTEKEGAARKRQIDFASKDLKAKQIKQTRLTAMIEQLRSDRTNLQRKIDHQRERRHHYAGELEMLESRLEEVDSQFTAIKDQVSEMVADGTDGALTQIDAGKGGMAEMLKDDLVALNKQLAHMLYIKGVKDTGEKISKDTQMAMLDRMEQREIYSFKDHPFRKMMVADDGTNLGRNLKRVFVNVATRYFKMAEQLFEDVSIKRLDGRAENSTSEEYPFIVLASDTPDDNYSDIRRIARKINTNMPDTYLMVMMPFGEVWKHDPASPEYQNLNSLKENSTLINSSITDLMVPESMLRLLMEKAPLN